MTANSSKWSFNPVNSSKCVKLISLSRERQPAGGQHSSDVRSLFRLIGGHRVSVPGAWRYRYGDERRQEKTQRWGKGHFSQQNQRGARIDFSVFPMNRKGDSIFILKASLALNLHKILWPWGGQSRPPAQGRSPWGQSRSPTRGRSP